MMKKIKLAKSFPTIIIILIFLFSCNKELKDLSPDGASTANNEIVNEAYSLDVEDLSSAAVLGAPNSGGREEAIHTGIDDPSKCAKITIEVGTEPNSGIITVDFGTTGCKDSKGHVRKGKMIITYAGKRFVPGYSVKVELVDYFINDRKVEGTRIVTSEPTSTELKPVSKIVLKDGKCTSPDGTFSTHEFTHVRTWIRSSNPLEDSWTVSGSGSGVSRKGVAYTMTITKDLVFKKSCEASHVFIAVSGIKVLNKGGKEITIDYGNGICNNLVSVTYNGVTKVIEIKR